MENTVFTSIKNNSKINVAFLIFHQVEALDLNGPLDIFTKASFFDDRYHVYTVSPTDEAVNSEGNTYQMKASYSFETAPQADILIIPGAHETIIHQIAKQENAIKTWVVQQHQKSTLTMSVCTGALLLAEWGVLDYAQATTHEANIEQLSLYPHIRVIENKRFVEDGKIITTAGITSGLDGALHMIEQINGKQLADTLAKILIYNRYQNMHFMESYG